MRRIKTKVTDRCMKALVSTVKVAATVGAGATSFFKSYQPRVPEKLRK